MEIHQTFPEERSFTFQGDSAENTAENTAFERFLIESYQPVSVTGIRGNLVIASDGSLSDDNGKSAGISSQLDRKILRLIRSFADVVIQGAATIRAEGLILPQSAKLAVLSAGTNISFNPSASSREQLLLFTSEASYAQVSARFSEEVMDIIPVSADLNIAVQLTAEVLASRGFRTLVCEGGAVVMKAFLQADLIDELAITLSPKIGSGNTRFDGWPDKRFGLVQEFRDEQGFRYQRWQRSKSPVVAKP